jgi:tetratricopeptide (TPR) repeat protein
MKLLISLLFLTIVVAAPSFAEVQWQSEPFPQVLKKAQDENKHVFIDFYTVWCAPCKMLEKTTYQDENVSKFLNDIIPVKYDCEKGEGIDLAAKFKIKAYPTLILLGPDGKEIDRQLGYLDAENFLKVMQGYMKGIGTIGYYEAELQKKPDDLSTLFTLGKKYANVSNEEKAKKYLEKIISLDPANKNGYTDQAHFELGDLFYGLKKYQQAAERFKLVTDKFPQSENVDYAMQMLARTYDKMGQEDECLKIYKRFVEKNPDDPGALNAFAWFCATHKIGIDEAIPYAEKAVKISGGDSGLMDTLAELHFAKGDYDKAVSIEEEASKKDPEDTYLKDQIIKYLKAALDEARNGKK